MELPDMKQFIFSTLVVVGVFAFISCERHEWEDKDGDKGTKRLYPQEEKKDHTKNDHTKDDHANHEGHNH